MSEHLTEEEFAPILPGRGASDYERYLRTDDLLELQKRPEEMTHRDELLFQTTHQSSELWLKLACFEVETATEHMRKRELAAAIRLLRRAVECIRLITEQIHMLEHMSPWEYQEVRRVLGHGSGFDSPGWNGVRRVTPPLGAAFHELLREQGLTVVELYRRGRELEELYQLGELLIEWDERVILWRAHHFKLVERVIGGEVVGTQGTPVEVLGNLVAKSRFPELWRARSELTELAKLEDETPPSNRLSRGEERAVAAERCQERVHVLARVVSVEGDAEVPVSRRGDHAFGLERGDERVLVGRGDRDERPASVRVARRHDPASQVVDSLDQLAVEPANVLLGRRDADLLDELDPGEPRVDVGDRGVPNSNRRAVAAGE